MAKSANHSLVVMLLAVGISGVLLTGALASHRVLVSKTAEQSAITQSVIRWKSSYRALAGTQEAWAKTYKGASSVRDQLALISLLDLARYGLSADTDSLVLRTDTAVTANNIDLALTKLCLGTGGDSFSVSAANYDALLRGLSQLTQRKDIFVDNISVLGDKSMPQAKLGDLCIFLRNE